MLYGDADARCGPALHAGSRGFESLIAHLSTIGKRSYGLIYVESERLRTTQALSPMAELAHQGNGRVARHSVVKRGAHGPRAQKTYGNTGIRPDLVTQFRVPLGRRNNRRRRPKLGWRSLRQLDSCGQVYARRTGSALAGTGAGGTRGDRTPLELFRSGVQGLPATIRAALYQAATG
jgi:hypothetical protein